MNLKEGKATVLLFVLVKFANVQDVSADSLCKHQLSECKCPLLLDVSDTSAHYQY